MPPGARTSARLQLVTVLAALAVALYLSWLLVRPFLLVLAWATVLAVLFHPVHRRLEGRLGRGSIAAALVSTLLVIVTVLAPTAGILTAAVQEVRELTDGASGSLASWLDPAHPTSGRAVTFVERYVSLDRLREPDFARQSLESGAGGLATGSLRVLGGAVGAAVQFGLVVFTMFFLFKDGGRLSRAMYDFVPVENRRLAALSRRTRDVIEASVYGTLLLSIIQGAMGGLAFLVLGLPSPFLWGIVMAGFSLIPMLGAFVVWVPAALYLAVSGSWWQAIALTAWGAGAIGMADNVLRPILVGNRTRMHELLIFFGVLGGIQVFGVLGLVLGPVVFAVTLALIQAAREVGAQTDAAPARRGPREKGPAPLSTSGDN